MRGRPPRLTEAQVREIITARDESPRPSPDELAAKYSVTRHTIYDIWQARTWQHIPREGRVRRPAIERLGEVVARKLAEEL